MKHAVEKTNFDLSETTLTLRRLGEFIEECDERNGQGEFDVDDVRGISINKAVINTKADMTGVLLASYKQFKHNEFCVVTVTSRNGGKISLARNEDDETYIVSSSYVVFRIWSEELMPEFLSLLFGRSEFDRYARFNSWGSAREVFSYADMTRVEIPVPPFGVQQEVVDVWRGLRKMKEENETLAAPLMQLCRSYLQACKKKYPMKEIGPLIERKEERNDNGSVKIVKSVSVTKEFKDTNAKVDKSNLLGYKIVMPGELSFVQTTGNEKCLCIAVNHFDEPIVVTSVNEVFKMKEESLDADYLYLWCCRPEFDRYARFNSWGSARETFTWSDMCRVKIPLPPIEVQQAIVDVYRCAREAKKIAEEVDRLGRKICPALVRWAAENLNLKQGTNHG